MSATSRLNVPGTALPIAADPVKLGLPWDPVRAAALTYVAEMIYEVSQGYRPVNDLDLPWIRAQLLDLRDVVDMAKRPTAD